MASIARLEKMVRLVRRQPVLWRYLGRDWVMGRTCYPGFQEGCCGHCLHTAEDTGQDHAAFSLMLGGLLCN